MKSIIHLVRMHPQKLHKHLHTFTLLWVFASVCLLVCGGSIVVGVIHYDFRSSKILSTWIQIKITVLDSIDGFLCYKIGSELPRDITLRHQTTPLLGKDNCTLSHVFCIYQGPLITINYASLQHPLKKEKSFLWTWSLFYSLSRSEVFSSGTYWRTTWHVS